MNIAWINLTDSVKGAIPMAREGHRFVRVADGSLYVFGGNSSVGEIILNTCDVLNHSVLKDIAVNQVVVLFDVVL